MKKLYILHILCIFLFLLISCNMNEPEEQQLSADRTDTLSVSMEGSDAAEQYDQAFLTHASYSITKQIAALDGELTVSKKFGPSIWDCIETYYADCDNRCITFFVYDYIPDAAASISVELGNADYLHFEYITASTIKAEVLSCGEWNEETGFQPIQMITLESNQVFESNQEISVRVETEQPLSCSVGDVVVVTHKNSYDASDPPIVYAFSVQLMQLQQSAKNPRTTVRGF